MNGTSRLFVPPPNKLSHSHRFNNEPYSPVNVADGLQKTIKRTAFGQKNETSVLLNYTNHLLETSDIFYIAIFCQTCSKGQGTLRIGVS